MGVRELSAEIRCLKDHRFSEKAVFVPELAPTSNSQKNVTNKTLISNLIWHKFYSWVYKANHIQT